MKNKKSVIASVVLSGALLVVGTLAYFNQTHTVDNKLSTKGFGSDIVEQFTPKEFNPGSTVTKKVRVDNTGDYNLVARAKWEESWTRGTSNFDSFAYPDVDNASAVIKGYPTNSKWVNGSDGWAYYNAVIPVGGSSENFLESITLKNSMEVVGEAINTYYYTTAAAEPAKTAVGSDPTKQWVKITKTEFDALDNENNSVKATFKRAEVKSNGLYDGAEYTLTITAQVAQANKEAVQGWIGNTTNATVKTFLNGLPSANN